MRHVPGYEEFKRGYGKSTKLYLFNNYNIGGGRLVNLILDSRCRTLLVNRRFNEIHLRVILGYHCCQHVVYCPFTCGDKIFFKKADYQEVGNSIYGFPCPFRDGGSSIPAQANTGGTEVDKRFVKIT